MAEPSAFERKNIGKLRLAETSREIGLLLVTFGTLDFVFDRRPIGVIGWIWVGGTTIGALLIALGIVAERRIYNAAD